MTAAIDTTGLGPAGLLIAKGWTQNAFARNKKGNQVEPNSSSAVCWCALGALSRCYDGVVYVDAKRALSAVIGTSLLLDRWSDSRDFEDVIEAFRKAGV